MLDPSKRLLTIVLSLGILVLVAGIALGQRAGDRVIGQVTEKRLESIAPVTVTPAPKKTSGANPYGPDWKRTEVMSAAGDPGFPDPRVPPEPLPTLTPPPKRSPTPPPEQAPTPSPTPNLNVPIWRRMAPMPTATPQESGSPGPAAESSGSPAAPTASPQPRG